MGQETDIQKRIQVALSKLAGLITFRNNTGTGWQGKTERGKFGALIIREPRPLDAGLCKGSADLIGWRSIVITPDMVGRRVAIFAAVEVKARSGRLTAEQRAFLEAVWRAGGIAGVARSEAEAVALAEGFNGRPEK